MGRARQEQDQQPPSAKWPYIAAAVAIVAVALLAAKLLTRTQVDWKDGSPAWSPDGKRIAFYSERDGNAEIYVMNADGTAVTRLTNSTADEGYPSWSPDGKRIAFMRRTGRTELFTMNADGSDQKPLLTVDKGDAIDPRWSPDGARIVFVHMPDGMTGRAAIICTVNADGTGLRHLR